MFGFGDIDQRQIGPPRRRLSVRKRLGEDVRGHQFAIGAIHLNFIRLKLLMKPCDANTMSAANVGHIRILAGPADPAACVIILEHL